MLIYRVLLLKVKRILRAIWLHPKLFTTVHIFMNTLTLEEVLLELLVILVGWAHIGTTKSLH
ncbi:hypothetical protein COF38_29925 [Bacillus pseudomycoides]|nr:hypothetical protein CN677_17410 [Bacillus pseudomycoides]PHC64009.1 hypothetical protein COF38_29925 [Bacillus pseudomycoides]PHE31140.1 hypothetical protein COF51_26590 [Bacillus pseudomycoides]